MRAKVTADGQHERACPEVGVMRYCAVLSESERVPVRALECPDPKHQSV